MHNRTFYMDASPATQEICVSLWKQWKRQKESAIIGVFVNKDIKPTGTINFHHK